MGCSIVLRLVIRSIDWTPSQLAVNPRREAEDTVSLRWKEKWTQEGWSKGKMMFSYAWLGLRKEHAFPNIATQPEDMVFSSLWTKLPWMKGIWKAINHSISTGFMLFAYRWKCKQLPGLISNVDMFTLSAKSTASLCNQHWLPCFNTWSVYELWSSLMQPYSPSFLSQSQHGFCN